MMTRRLHTVAISLLGVFCIVSLFADTVSLLNKSVDETISSLEEELSGSMTVVERVDVLNSLAWNNIFGNPSLCQGYLEESLQLSVAHRYVEGEAYAYDIWGSIFRVNGLYEESIKSHLKSLRLNEKISNAKGMAINYSNIGLVYAEEKDWEQSVEYHLKALKIKKQLKTDPDGLSFTYNDLVFCYIELNRLEEAISYNQELIKLRETSGVKGDLAAQYFHGARIQYELEHIDEALSYLGLAEEQLGFKRNYWVKIQCDMLWASILSTQKRRSEASEYAMEAFRLAKKYQMIEFQRQSAGILAENYAAMGNFSDAYHYRGVQNQILERSFGSDVSKKTAVLTAKYEFDKEQVQLHSEFQQRMLKLGAATLVLLILLVGSTTFTVFYTRKTRKLQVANKHIEEQKSLIEEQAEHLKELNSTKDKVFSIVAHDLRSPLAALSTLLDLFAEDTIGREEFKKMTDTLSRSVRTVNDTLTQLLFWAKAQQNEMSSIPQRVNIHTIASDKVELFENTAQLKNISLISEVTENVYVHADEDQLRLVLHNLVNNALKFTKESGRVTISALIRGSSVEVTVEDNGVGMEEAAIANLFKHVYNKSSPGTKGERGTGLGLVLCKEMIERNNGSISLDSEIGKGTIVRFTLPRAKDRKSETYIGN